ncbi:ABC transporter permease [Fulvivirgaceae bacterium PWU4]|uniref:ABC transporter permease n=1 Tax=Chryseosolibacter histidini TaxID=2782349 RepID=A0AAP2DFM9_9BACT|nr:ABC transporter permease [Chryseosolibacter histidini]MBT1695325.1 ABC transporter permease [Chryseosolibacter histidini]
MMLRNYLRIAFRNMTRSMRFSILHISGLAVGLASVILIAWYVYDEISFDNLPGAAQVYRINTYWGDDPETNMYATTPPPLAAVIQAEIPEVEKVARAFTWNHSTMRLPAEEHAGKDEVVFRETRIFIVDPQFLDIMQYPVISGERKSAFTRPESIVITKETALRYFGQDALDRGAVIGKSILFGGDRTARIVSAVIDPPANTHFHFDMLVHMGFGYDELGTLKVWTWNIMHTYVKVNEAVANDPDRLKALQAKLSSISTRYIKPAAGDHDDVSAADFRLQPLRDIHLHSHLLREHEPNGDHTTVQVLVTIAVLILVLACANFVNLFTVQSARRAKEVGVRKTLGSGKGGLAFQFFVEASLYTFIAALLALGLAELLLIPFNALSGKQLSFDWGTHPVLFAGMAAVFLLVVFFSGSYPSIYLSSFSPVRALKGNLLQQTGKNNFRNALVVLQFSISIGLMICSVLVLQQLLFLQNRAPGYQRENVIIVKNDREIQDQWRAFRDELQVHASITSVSFTTGLPAQPLNVMRDFRLRGDAANTGMHWFLADENYLAALGLELQQGSWFSPDETANTQKVVINETAARILALDEPVGRQLVMNYGAPDEEHLEIIGVVKDFNVESFHSEVKPVVLRYYTPDYAMDYVAVRIHPGNPSEALSVVEKAWKKFEPENPFVYSFLDKDLERQYLSEQRLSKLFGGFTLLALIIAVLGLTGLASFMAELRTKEIGIRKVLGATAAGIIVLFSRDFTRLVLLATAIAIPVSYWFMKQWLGDFAYRIEMSAGVFILCSLAALVLMWVTVSLLSFRVARLNPAETLKTE